MPRCLSTLLGACLLVAATTALAAIPVRIGILAYRGPDEAVASWSDLPGHLKRAIPTHQFELRHMEGPALREAVRAGELDFVLANPNQYVSLAAEFGIQRIATVMLPEALSSEQALGSTIITLAKRSDIQRFDDLHGKRIAAMAVDAFGGYLIAAYELHRAGIDLESGDARLLFVGPPMRRAVEALLAGQADAAIVRTCLLEQLAALGKLRPEAFRVVSPRDEPAFPCVTSTPLYPDWAFAVTRNGDRQLAKRVATLLLSLPPSASGLSWGVPADYQSVHDIYRELMLGPYADLRTITLRGVLKSYRPYLFAALLLLFGGLIHVIWVSYLVRSRTAALEAARARTRRLEEEATHMAQLSILGEMSGTLAHELNQPLATIAAYAQGLQRRCTAGQAPPQVVAEATHEIVSQTERASDVIRRVRSFVRKRVAVRESRPLLDTVGEAVKLFSVLLPELPPVTLEDRLPADAAVEADHVMLQQVLLNLMKNAADAMSTLPTAERRIRIVMDREDAALTIAVADRGPEVPAETFDHLFEAFFTTKPGGLGLGLAICKSIVEAHGGWLRAERRQPPPGLVFRFSLPDDRNHG